jgi:hypothetical protein
MARSEGGMLTRPDLDLHAAMGIDADLLRRAGVYRVDDLEGRDLLSLNGKPGHVAGIVYPYLDPRSGRTWTLRIRLDDGTDGKYRSPYGDNRHVYFPPGAGALLPQPTVPVIVVESEKAALALTAAAIRAGRRVLPIALGGCWSWRGRIGKTTNAAGARVDEKGPLPDFHLVAWSDRPTFILFDARANDSVQAARQQLARVLRQWGAIVHHAHLPDDDPRVNGPDDLIRAQGDLALWAVLEAALPEEFVLFAKGPRKDQIIPDALDNIRIALARLRVRPVYDAFRREIHIDARPVDDVTLDRVWLAIDDTFHFRPSKETLHTVIVGEAHARPVHPVRRYLDGLTWDGTERLDTWLIDYAGADDTPYVRAVGALVLIAAVRRIRQPGVKFDELLILESPQGTYKSSALRALCPDEDWFSDDLPLGVDSKLVIERTAGKWLIEAAELHGNRGREAEQLKAFLSRQVDGPVRLAYGRLPVTVPRQFIIVGTTNSRLAYLKDSTGGRRFWPVAIQHFALDAMTTDRDQLWAEAAAREATGASIRLDPSLWQAAGHEQEARRADDPWEAILHPLLEGDGITAAPTRVTAAEIWDRLKLEANHLDNRHADRVAAILQRHGFTRGRPYVDGKQMRCWVRDETSTGQA